MKRLTRWVVCATLAASLGVTGCVTPQPLSAPEAPSQTQETAKKDSVTSAEPNAKYETMNGAEDGMMAQEESLGYMPPVDAGPSNTEEYDSVEESGFVAVAATPLSTISADVDTASYANVRRMLKDGYKPYTAEDKAKHDDSSSNSSSIVVDEKELTDEDPYYLSEHDVIPKGAVRIEEMLNYFTYDYPAPEGEEPFKITARMGPCPWNKDTELLVLGYATGKEDESFAKKGSNLVFLIDVSGSMKSDDKLGLLKDSFSELTKGLGENDRVSVVTYSGKEEVVLEGAKGSERDTIMRAIRGLEAGGSTNGEAGLRMAYKLAEDNYIEGGVNRIVLASDGDLNVGMSSESDLHDYVDKQREKGVYLSVLGFGTGNYKDNKMETLADHGNGSYHYIDSLLEAKRVFGERLTANLVPFANDVKVQLEFNPAKVKGYRLIGYENRALAAEDFKDDKKDAAEVGPNSQFTVAYEVVRTDSAMQIEAPELKYEQQSDAGGASNEWLTAKLRYKPAAGGDVREQELVVNDESWSEDPGTDWRFAAAVSEFGMLLRDSEFKGSATYDSVHSLVGKTDDELRQEFLDLVDMAKTN